MIDETIQKPKNSLEFVRWLIFEPILLREYSDKIKDKWERLRAMALPMVWIALGSFLIYLISIGFIVGLDLPVRNQDWFKGAVTENWTIDVWTDFFLLFNLSIKYFLSGLALGLAFSLAFGLAVDLAAGLAVGLALGLAFGLAGGLAYGLTVGLTVGLASGLASGLAFGLAFGLTQGLAYGLAYGLTQGLAVGLVVGSSGGLSEVLTFGLLGGLSGGLTIGLAFGLSWIIFYYRLYSFSFYTFCSFLGRYSLKKNPHWSDWAIGFPIPDMEKKFMSESYESPEQGMEFSIFLLKRRATYQSRLAYMVGLASYAGMWKINRNHVHVLKELAFPPDEYAIRPIRYNWIFFKSTGTQRSFESATPDWYTQLETTRQYLSDFERESNVQRRVRYFRVYQTELHRLYDIALRQPEEWGTYFVKALELWKKSASDTLRDLELEAAAQEPIAANIYRGGEKLMADDTDLFFGRNDLRDSFKNRVVTAVQMPLFFIQGRRRVGKSSLIAFLPSFLDRSFTVIPYDMQEQPGIAFTELLQKLRERIYITFQGIEAPDQELPLDWLSAWGVFKAEIDSIAQNQEVKIVLAIDEYEEFHRILQTNPGEGGKLLAAMRSWSQSQNRVVLLFAGSDFFSELKSPNWAEYFVQSERLLVDYLNRDDSYALIQLVGLKYPPELLERMYYETQGHPCLLQKICREVVTIANKTGRESRAIVEADYEEALKRTLLMPDDGVVNIFWQQFCENRGLKNTIRQIIKGEIPSDERNLLMLEDHGFIVRDETIPAKWRLRVPLFELWLRRYQVT